MTKERLNPRRRGMDTPTSPHTPEELRDARELQAEMARGGTNITIDAALESIRNVAEAIARARMQVVVILPAPPTKRRRDN